MKILIPNATGPTNVGDQIILHPVLKILSKTYRNAIITVHTTSPKMYEKSKIIYRSNLYEWAVFKNKNPFMRVKRILELFLAYLSMRFSWSFLIQNSELNKIIVDYKEADLIVLIGGGYFRTQAKFSQSLNLFMLSSSFYFSKLTKVKKIVLPISFGPFAYKWQEKFASHLLNNLDMVSSREDYSFILLKKYKVKNLIKSKDTAFMFSVKKRSKKENKKSILGFTIREWLKPDMQDKFELEFASAIINFSKKYDYEVQPIVQVSGAKYGESDEEITKRIVKILKVSKVEVLKTHTIKNIDRDIYIYSKIDLLLGMRMHSNILSGLFGTPFTAISYEHKTTGISKELDMLDYCIDVKKSNSKNLYDMLKKEHKNKIKISRKLLKITSLMRESEEAKWVNILPLF